MISIANPIYDVVFKYLMEDKRVARTILSALLKKDIIDVDIRPHEYTNDKNAAITMLRIDFGATVREADGSEHLILIELQKTWIETETLRFRQYLGVQYENPKNMMYDGQMQHALPMVAVYMLGHRVGDIEEPVLYVRHHAYDYNDRPVTKGLPDPFVESLTHDSIIVQIPLLHGQVNNRVEQVLSIFDQSYMDGDNRHVLNMDDSLYEGDADMEHILSRLLKAASNPKMRQDMNIEEEFMSAIERRDTEILNRDYELARQKVELRKQSAQLEEQSAQLEEQSAQLEEQSAQLEEQSAQLRKSVQLLSKASLSVEDIASQLGMDVDVVRCLLG